MPARVSFSSVAAIPASNLPLPVKSLTANTSLPATQDPSTAPAQKVPFAERMRKIWRDFCSLITSIINCFRKKGNEKKPEALPFKKEALPKTASKEVLEPAQIEMPASSNKAPSSKKTPSAPAVSIKDTINVAQHINPKEEFLGSKRSSSVSVIESSEEMDERSSSSSLHSKKDSSSSITEENVNSNQDLPPHNGKTDLTVPLTNGPKKEKSDESVVVGGPSSSSSMTVNRDILMSLLAKDESCNNAVRSDAPALGPSDLRLGQPSSTSVLQRSDSAGSTSSEITVIDHNSPISKSLNSVITPKNDDLSSPTSVLQRSDSVGSTSSEKTVIDLNSPISKALNSVLSPKDSDQSSPTSGRTSFSISPLSSPKDIPSSNSSDNLAPKDVLGSSNRIINLTPPKDSLQIGDSFGSPLSGRNIVDLTSPFSNTSGTIAPPNTPELPSATISNANSLSSLPHPDITMPIFSLKPSEKPFPKSILKTKPQHSSDTASRGSSGGLLSPLSRPNLSNDRPSAVSSSLFTPSQPSISAGTSLALPPLHKAKSQESKRSAPETPSIPVVNGNASSLFSAPSHGNANGATHLNGQSPARMEYSFEDLIKADNTPYEPLVSLADQNMNMRATQFPLSQPSSDANRSVPNTFLVEASNGNTGPSSSSLANGNANVASQPNGQSPSSTVFSFEDILDVNSPYRPLVSLADQNMNMRATQFPPSQQSSDANRSAPNTLLVEASNGYAVPSSSSSSLSNGNANGATHQNGLSLTPLIQSNGHANGHVPTLVQMNGNAVPSSLSNGNVNGASHLNGLSSIPLIQSNGNAGSQVPSSPIRTNGNANGVSADKEDKRSHNLSGHLEDLQTRRAKFLTVFKDINKPLTCSVFTSNPFMKVSRNLGATLTQVLEPPATSEALASSGELSGKRNLVDVVLAPDGNVQFVFPQNQRDYAQRLQKAFGKVGIESSFEQVLAPRNPNLHNSKQTMLNKGVVVLKGLKHFISVLCLICNFKEKDVQTLVFQYWRQLRFVNDRKDLAYLLATAALEIYPHNEKFFELFTHEDHD